MSTTRNHSMMFMSLMVLLAGLAQACNSDEDDPVDSYDPDKVIEVEIEDGPDSTINSELFDVINLDYPGLEKVKSYYEEGNLYKAASELLTYYRMRGTVTNTNVDLLNPTCTESDINMAEQATKAGGYRFYVRNYQESTDETTGLAIYYSFMASDGSIDWDFTPDGLTDQEWYSQKHRLQWMRPQAKAYRATGDEDYINAWIEIFGDWIDTFPCPEGTATEVQWTGLQPAERLIDLSDCFEYYKQSSNFTPAWLSKFLVSYAEHVENIRNNPYGEDDSNIRLSQNQAVTYAGILMPEFKNASDWLTEGSTEITRQLTDQFNDDGVQNELDPSYHIGVVSNFIEIYNLAKANGVDDLFPSDYATYLHKACRFVMDIMYPNYSMENLNDTRSARWSSRVLLRNLLNYVSIFPDDDELRYMATQRTSGTVPSTDPAIYSTSGYYIFRNGWESSSTMLILKNNYNPEDKWHCQPDNGTVTLFRNGRRFLPDAGVFTYGGDSESYATREAYRSTRVHNTINKNGLNVTTTEGRFLGSGSGDGYEWVSTENDSYSDLSHRRTVFFVDKQFFVIADEGYGSGSDFPVELCMNLPEKSMVEIDSEYGDGMYGAHTIYDDNNNMAYKTFCETTEGFTASNTTGYYSDDINTRVQRRIYRVRITKQSGLAARFITVLYPIGKADEYDGTTISASFTDNEGGTPGTFHEDGTSVEVTVGDKTYELTCEINN